MFLKKVFMKKENEIHTDICIVGSGPGGSVLAHKLVNAGFKVLLVEAGEFKPQKNYKNNAPQYFSKTSYNSGLTPILGNVFAGMVLPKIVGGGSEINSAIIKEIPKKKLYEWAIEIKDKTFISNINRAYKEIDSEFSTETTSLENDDFSQLVNNGLMKLNWDSQPLPRATEKCTGTGFCLTNCPSSKKKTMSQTYLNWIYNNENFKILKGSTAQRFVIESKKVKKLICKKSDSTQVEIQAKYFVSCAGVVGTPILLRNSKIKNKNIGKNLSLHFGVAVLGEFKQELNVGSTQGWSSEEFADRGLIIENLRIPRGLLSSRVPIANMDMKQIDELIKHSCCLTIKNTSSSKGRLFFMRGKAIPKIKMNKADLEELLYGIHIISKILFEAGAIKVHHGLAPLKNTAECINEVNNIFKKRLKPKNLELMCNHVFSTARMSHSKENGVVDKNLKVFGLDNLFISDASVIPFAITNNPQKTIMALSINLGEHLKGKSDVLF